MPGLHTDPRVRVFERLVLEPAGVKPKSAAQLEQPFPICAHQVNHRLIVDLVAVKPNAAVEGEAHPLTAALEFPIRRLYVQVIRPSAVAGATGDAFPWYSTHCRVVWA